jgi:putative membrane protein
MKRILMSAASVLFLGFVAQAAPADQPGHASPAPGTANDTMSAVKDATGHAVGTVSAEMTHSLQGFVTAAAISDMYEVEAGKIAADRSHNAQVRAFAEKMVKAHTATTEKLKGLLVDAGGNVTPPAHLDDRHQGMVDELRGAQDQDFDNRYISQQIAAHNEALILMRGYAKDGDAPAIRKFAAQTAPVVKMHLQMANAISQKLK